MLKASNVRKLVRNLQTYFHEVLHKDTNFTSVDQTAMAKQADATVILRFVEWVAAAAVTCPEKGDYIGRIMRMTPENQAAMKEIIESSLSRLSDYTDDLPDAEENELVFGSGGTGGDDDDDDVDDDDDGIPNKASRKKDGMDSINQTHLFGHDLEMEQQLTDARREIATLKSQAAVADEEAEKVQQKLRALVEDLQERLQKRQEDLQALEDDLQRTDKELQEYKTKIGNLEEQNARLADDLDVANAKAAQLHKAEATLAAYKKKLDSAGATTQQMAELEDQASNYLRQIMELENEVKKSAGLQKTVTELQDKIAELEKHRSHTESSTKTSVSEIAELKSQLQAAESAKRMYEHELNELRAQQEVAAEPVAELQIVQSQSKEEREKVMRLEIENRQLKEEVEKLQSEAAAAAAAAASAARSVQQAPELLGVERTAAVAAPSESVTALHVEVTRLKEQLEIKEKEIARVSGDKDKLEAYTKRTLAKFQDKYLVALQECKAKLKEKQDKIEVLEQRSASERTAQKREERLLSSVVYELGLAIMQNRLKSGAS